MSTKKPTAKADPAQGDVEVAVAEIKTSGDTPNPEAATADALDESTDSSSGTTLHDRMTGIDDDTRSRRCDFQNLT